MWRKSLNWTKQRNCIWLLILGNCPSNCDRRCWVWNFQLLHNYSDASHALRLSLFLHRQLIVSLYADAWLQTNYRCTGNVLQGINIAQAAWSREGRWRIDWVSVGHFVLFTCFGCRFVLLLIAIVRAQVHISIWRWLLKISAYLWIMVLLLTHKFWAHGNVCHVKH